MKKYIINLILIMWVLIIYVINNHIIKVITEGLANYFFKNHFNDLLCSVLYLAFAEILLGIFKIDTYRLWLIIVIAITTSFIWEVIGPVINTESVSDYKDVICYFIGAIVYYLLMKILRIKGIFDE